MSIQAIIELTNRLYDNYNPETSQKVRESKIDLLRIELKGYSAKQIGDACQRIMQDENIKKFPNVAQLKAFIPRWENKQDSKGCVSCEDTGYYTIWQKRDSMGKYYSFSFRCRCEKGQSFMEMPDIDPIAIPRKAHNPYPPTDNRHKEYNERKQ